MTGRDQFFWGAATAAYQIEGAVDRDGRGPSIWDTFSHTPGKILCGHTGDVAADHYARWQEDVAIVAQLNLNAYRFSIAWSRILSDGRGDINERGLDFYDRLVDGLLEAGVTPFTTLYHFDLPQALQDNGGGWLNRDVVEAFCEFADAVTRRLGDRVNRWITINEPWTATSAGYMTGEDAPGLTLGLDAGLQIAHHLLLAHGAGVEVVRANVPDGRVGISLDVNTVEPASDAQEDVAAAGRYEAVQNRWYLDSLFRGTYPQAALDLVSEEALDIRPGDLERISQPIDFLGINIYRRSVIGVGNDMPPVSFRRVNPPGNYTQMGWEVYPPSIYDTLISVHREYDPHASCTSLKTARLSRMRRLQTARFTIPSGPIFCDRT